MPDRDLQCDVVVLGAGPGGYIAALRCAQRGLDTVVIDRGSFGGTCLTVGCIPSKAMIHVAERFATVRDSSSLGELGIETGPSRLDLATAVGWKDSVVARLTGGVETLLRSAGVTRLHGEARVVDGKTVRVATSEGSVRVRTSHLVLATGSVPVELPDLRFGGPIMSSTEALAMTELPRALAVVGAGYIGLELGTAFAKMGVSVTVIEMADAVLPQYDAALTRPVAARLEQLGVRVQLGARATGYDADGSLLHVRAASGDSTVAADKVLVTVGRRPATDGWGLDELNLTRSGRAIAIDDRCRTSMAGVYAIGDVTGDPMLAHRASAQAELVAEVIAGEPSRWNDRIVPEVCFTDPEIISIGWSPERASSEGVATVTGVHQFAANGRALTMGDSVGFVRVVADSTSGLVVGIQAVGAGVSELAAGATAAIEMGATLIDLHAIMHPHPTLSEAIAEAALQAAGRALHGPKSPRR